MNEEKGPRYPQVDRKGSFHDIPVSPHGTSLFCLHYRRPDSHSNNWQTEKDTVGKSAGWDDWGWRSERRGVNDTFKTTKINTNILFNPNYNLQTLKSLHYLRKYLGERITDRSSSTSERREGLRRGGEGMEQGGGHSKDVHWEDAKISLVLLSACIAARGKRIFPLHMNSF